MGTEHSIERNPNRAGTLRDERMTHPLPTNSSPLRFHSIHGENITLSKNNTVACRSEGFCKGIVFSERPIAINERVHVRFLEVSPNWSGALRIGFTMNNPLTMKSKVPKYACPDLTSMHGNWAKAVGEKLAKKHSILYFYVDENGDVHYGIGSDECGIFFGGVNTGGKLWAVLDIYGNTVAVEFVDPRYNQAPNSSTSSLFPVESSRNPPAFHSVHGVNVTLVEDRTTAVRKQGIYSSYVFTEGPIEIGKRISVIITKAYYKTFSNASFTPLSYGITSCNPSTIDPNELPQNPDDLVDRLEYWVVKHIPSPFEVGDNLNFTLSSQGELEVSLNEDSNSMISLFVDATQSLWLFLHFSDGINEIRLISSLSSRKSDYELVGNGGFAEIPVVNDNIPGPSGQKSSNECIICYEAPVNCVVYRCGHMCMCYDCALKLHKNTTTTFIPLCPICRNPIEDIIRTYEAFRS